MTKILYLINSLSIGGAERQFVELIRGIRKTTDIDPIVATFEPSSQGFEGQLRNIGVPMLLVKRRSKYDIGLVIKLIKIIRHWEIDIVHSFSVLAGCVGVMCGRLSGVRVIASSIRNSKDASFAEYCLIRVQGYLADYLVANSRAGLTSRFKRVKSNFRVVYNGIDPARFKINHGELQLIRERYRLSDYQHVVTMIASLSVYKDHDTLIEAAPTVLSREPGTVFLLVGDGTERPRLEKKVRKYGLEANFIFAGYTQNICEMLALSSVSVLMTNERLITEGLSNGLLESLAMGVPVIASAGGGTEEIVEDGKTGLLVKSFDSKGLADAILRLIIDVKQANRYGTEGRNSVESKFSYERYLSEYCRLYNDLMAHHGRQYSKNRD